MLDRRRAGLCPLVLNINLLTYFLNVFIIIFVKNAFFNVFFIDGINVFNIYGVYMVLPSNHI